MAHVGFFNWANFTGNSGLQTATLGGQGARLFGVTVCTALTGTGAVTISDGNGGTTIASLDGKVEGTYFFMVVVSNNVFVSIPATITGGNITVVYT